MRLLPWLSAGLNLVFFKGDPDESLSARAYRQGRCDQRWLEIQLRIDRFFGDNHCKQAYFAQLAREDQRRRLM